MPAMHVFDSFGRFPGADADRRYKKRIAAFSTKHFYGSCVGIAIFCHTDDRYMASYLIVQVLSHAWAVAMRDIAIDYYLGKGDLDVLDKLQQAGEFAFVEFSGLVFFYTVDQVRDRVVG